MYKYITLSGAILFIFCWAFTPLMAQYEDLPCEGYFTSSHTKKKDDLRRMIQKNEYSEADKLFKKLYKYRSFCDIEIYTLGEDLYKQWKQVSTPAEKQYCTEKLLTLYQDRLLFFTKDPKQTNRLLFKMSREIYGYLKEIRGLGGKERLRPADYEYLYPYYRDAFKIAQQDPIQYVSSFNRLSMQNFLFVLDGLCYFEAPMVSSDSLQYWIDECGAYINTQIVHYEDQAKRKKDSKEKENAEKWREVEEKILEPVASNCKAKDCSMLAFLTKQAENLLNNPAPTEEHYSEVKKVAKEIISIHSKIACDEEAYVTALRLLCKNLALEEGTFEWKYIQAKVLRNPEVSEAVRKELLAYLMQQKNPCISIMVQINAVSSLKGGVTLQKREETFLKLERELDNLSDSEYTCKAELANKVYRGLFDIYKELYFDQQLCAMTKNINTRGLLFLMAKYHNKAGFPQSDKYYRKIYGQLPSRSTLFSYGDVRAIKINCPEIWFNGRTVAVITKKEYSSR